MSSEALNRDNRLKLKTEVLLLCFQERALCAIQIIRYYKDGIKIRGPMKERSAIEESNGIEGSRSTPQNKNSKVEVSRRNRFFHMEAFIFR